MAKKQAKAVEKVVEPVVAPTPPTPPEVIEKTVDWLCNISCTQAKLLDEIMVAVQCHDEELVRLAEELRTSTIFVPDDVREVVVEDNRTGERHVFPWDRVTIFFDTQSMSGLTKDESILPRISSPVLEHWFDGDTSAVREVVAFLQSRGPLLPFWDLNYPRDSRSPIYPGTAWDEYTKLDAVLHEFIFDATEEAKYHLKEAVEEVKAPEDVGTMILNFEDDIARLRKSLAAEESARDTALEKLTTETHAHAGTIQDVVAILTELRVLLRQRSVKAAIDAIDKPEVQFARDRLRQFYATYIPVA